MKFVDIAKVLVKAGDGGSGKVSFRQEKFIDRGGPDGGDGGNGGNVVFVASRNHNTLVSFRYQRELKAEPGEPGGKTRKHGRRGKDLEVLVPVGTQVTEDGVVIADLTVDGQTEIIAAGGRGGFGNAHFLNSTRQAPKFAEPGEEGEEKQLDLELKLIADVGLVGLPNAGKSTFLSVVSNARPKVADYPFTTLTPNLGMADVAKGESLLIADIPGLIEGAAEGKGLGDEFLRHVERTSVLLHLVDVGSEDVARDYTVIENEVKSYSVKLASQVKIVVLSKTDTVLPEQVEQAKKALQKVVPKGTKLFAISAQAHQNLKELLFATLELVKAERQRQEEENSLEETASDIPVLTLASSEEKWVVSALEGNVFEISGGVVDKFAVRTDFTNEESIQRYKAILQKHGVLHDLVRRGATTGSTILVGNKQFEL